MLDLCTGSGCILLSILKNLKQGTGVGIDISEQALEVARRNAKRLGLEAATTFVLSDLFEGTGTVRYDRLQSALY